MQESRCVLLWGSSWDSAGPGVLSVGEDPLSAVQLCWHVPENLNPHVMLQIQVTMRQLSFPSL